MKKILLFLSCMLASISTLWAQPTLKVKFDHPQNLEINGKTIPVEGTFTSDGFLVYGEKGLSLPADQLVGESGTLIYQFKVDVFKEPLLHPRYLLSLRTKSLLSISIYTFPNNPLLHVAFADKDKKYYFKTSKPLVPNQIYQVAITWDGDKVRIYIDGIMQAETIQPMPFTKVAGLHIGPYKDGWLAPKPWGNDSMIGELITYNRALSAAEIIKLSGVTPESAAVVFPTQVTVPERVGADFIFDGELNEPAWTYAAGLISLIDGKLPQQSFELPPSSIKLLYDRENLYVGFTTLFPGRVSIKEGNPRTEQQEPEVWGDESFEFYLAIDNNLFRFAGNVAGGYTESKNADPLFNGKWIYKTTQKMRIDDRLLWQGEIAIPWATLGLNIPPADALGFNFGRTWRLPATSTFSSLVYGQYNAVDQYPQMRLAKNAPILQIIAQNNPESGNFEQKIHFADTVNANVEYNILLSRTDGSAAPLTLLKKNLTLKANSPVTEKLTAPIQQSGYNCLIFQYLQGKKLLMQQTVPFQLNEEFAQVSPDFLAEKLQIKIKHDLLTRQFGANIHSRLQIIDPAGKVIYRQSIQSPADYTVAFPRQNLQGEYLMELRNDKDDALIYSHAFQYPGIGKWETLTFDDRIIPPFTAQQTVAMPNRQEVSLWGRSYLWDGSLFPTQIHSQQTALLHAPVSLEIDGKSVGKSIVKTGKTAPNRTDFTVAAQNENYIVSGNSWIEYDGIQWNEIKLKALRDLKNITLKISMPSALVRYLHTSDNYSWGTKITEAVQNGERNFRFYPVVWLGSEDKGLCFFAESRENWKSPVNQTYRLIKNADSATLEINLATELKTGETLPFEFGLLASPVRPLPANYPLNTFGWHHSIALNRPEGAPTTETAIMATTSQLGEYFGNLPTIENSQQASIYKQQIAQAHQAGGKAIPYTCDRYLSDEYPEMVAFKNNWKISPELTLDYVRDGRKHFMFDCCPTTGASAFFIYQYQEMLKRHQLDGIYFDFGLVPFCNNNTHGCKNRIPLLAQREFYRRIILAQLDAGIKNPVIVLHNTDSVQLPAMTFATHLFNGEQIRQHSSTIMHNGKDILDTYDISMFANELNSLPFGLTNSVYQSNDVLIPQFGGGKEDPELYKFRITQAMLAGTLPHNTMPSPSRCHYGIFDKLIRIYDQFGVPEAQFYGYWKNPAQILLGNDIYVSVYKHASSPRLLAVISHIGKAHGAQEVEIRFDAKKLGLPTLNHAGDQMTKPDPAYADLAEKIKSAKVAPERAPLKLGDFGSSIHSMKDNVLKLTLNHHCFAIVELTE